MQSFNRAIVGGEVIASITGSIRDYLRVRAGNGLSFQGTVRIVSGDIDLFSFFGNLSARGSLSAQEAINLGVVEGFINLGTKVLQNQTTDGGTIVDNSNIYAGIADMESKHFSIFSTYAISLLRFN